MQALVPVQSSQPTSASTEEKIDRILDGMEVLVQKLHNLEQKQTNSQLELLRRIDSLEQEQKNLQEELVRRIDDLDPKLKMDDGFKNEDSDDGFQTAPSRGCQGS